MLPNGRRITWRDPDFKKTHERFMNIMHVCATRNEFDKERDISRYEDSFLIQTELPGYDYAVFNVVIWVNKHVHQLLWDLGDNCFWILGNLDTICEEIDDYCVNY